MDNQRLFLFVALSLVLMLLYSAWQEQYGPKPIPAQVQAPAVPGTAPEIPSSDSPAPAPQEAPSVQPGSDVPSAQPAPAVAPATADSGQSAVLAQQQRVHVVTDLLEVEIDTKGGDIRRAALRQYPIKLEEPDKPIVLFNDTLPKVLIAQSGLLANMGESIDHHAVFSVEQTEYQLADGQDSLKVVLTWTSDKGITLSKTYTFHRDSYEIEMLVSLINNSGQDWSGRFYRQLQRSDVTSQEQSSFIYTFTGGVVSNDLNKYEKIDLDEMSSWKAEQSYIKNGWVAMIQHYFIGAWIPLQDQYNFFYTKALNNGLYLIGMSTAESKVAAGSTGEFRSKLFIGPKEQDRLAAAAPHLELTVDYGVLTLLADPLFWLLDFIHEYVQNWGWSIVLVTLIIKLLFYKLSEAAYRSMANMRKFQPKIMAIRERYGSDKQRMSQAMMDLYKKEKINPLGGCLPMLVQIPVFIALYWVLLESVELRQAPFVLWIVDLSAKDPFYILPLIMGASMFVQQKLNPAPMDPMQQKILQFLPVVFTLFFAFFPSGLVLYWVANNILSIIQQWYITRKIEATT